MCVDTTVDNWRLLPPVGADIDELMGWFPDARSVDIWGGPDFRFLFSRDSFLEDCKLAHMHSYCLRDAKGEMAAFGQFYDRNGRVHLARLITNPNKRRQGVGRRLISQIINAAKSSSTYREASLFVYRDNEPAYRCYLASGFRIQDYPDDARMKDRCYYMTRPFDSVPAQPG